MMRRIFGTGFLLFAAVLATAFAAVFFGEDNPREAIVPLMFCVAFVIAGVTTLRSVEPPIYGSGWPRWLASTIFLVVATFMAMMFIVILVGEGSDAHGDSAIPLFLALLFGGCGLGLRGTDAFGSFRNNLALLGGAAVVVPLLILIFVFAFSNEETFGPREAPAPNEEAELNEVGRGAVERETTIQTGVSDVVMGATLLLMFAGAGAVWMWSRRAVAPMAEITTVANEIQLGSLDRRIGMKGAAKEIQELADSFDRMLDRLARSSGTQQRLIEDASHELRTPLAALLISNEVLVGADDLTPQTYREAAERNQALIERMQANIDDLLAGGRAEAQQLSQVDNDLMAIVARVADQHRVLHPDVPIAVRGPSALLLGIDGPSVQRALVNLVQNAARYSPPSMPVEIDVTAGPSDIHLSVTDHGPGIPPDDIDSVFDRYYQSLGSDVGTAGIGLALVKQVADAYGGIEVTSPVNDNCGTRFTLVFACRLNSAVDGTE